MRNLKQFFTLMLVIMMVYGSIIPNVVKAESSEGERAITSQSIEQDNWSDKTSILHNSPEADLVVRTGDIDNLGFGWPQGFNPFSGQNTPYHYFPWAVDKDDPTGTDRIMLLTSYNGNPPHGQDGYTSSNSRPENSIQPITLQFDMSGISLHTAKLQMFVDDFQAPTWGASYQVTLNGVRAPFLEDVINSLTQTGPIGKLVTVQIPQEYLPLIQSGNLSINIDDQVTGAGDGYAIDFARLLINPKETANLSKLTGVVTEKASGKPIENADVSVEGLNLVKTKEDGSYSLDIPAGIIRIKVSKDGFKSESKLIDTTANSETQLNFELEDGWKSDTFKFKDVTPNEIALSEKDKLVTISGEGFDDFDNLLRGTFSLVNTLDGKKFEILPSTISKKSDEIFTMKLSDDIGEGSYHFVIQHPEYGEFVFENAIQILKDSDRENRDATTLKVGQITIKGDIEQDSKEKNIYHATGDIVFNDLLYYAGELTVDTDTKKIEGNGKLYIPIKEKSSYFAGQISLYEGKFSIDGLTSKLVKSVTGKSLLTYDGFYFNINNVEITLNSIKVEGDIDLAKVLKVDMDPTSITTNITEKGLDLNANVNLPDFEKGPLGIEDAEFHFDTASNSYGGSGTVGEVGKLITPAKGSVSGEFEIVKGNLNKISLKAKLIRPLPIAQSGFGISGLGGGLDNIQKINSNYGVTLFVLSDIADLFSPEIDGNHLINGNDLKIEASDLHLGLGAGALQLYKYQLGSASAKWLFNRGFDASGKANIADIYEAGFDMKKMDGKPFNGHSSGELKIPDSIWLIGGKSIGFEGDVNDKKISGSISFWGVTISCSYTFKNHDFDFESSSTSKQNSLKQQFTRDGTQVTFGSNLSRKGSYSPRIMGKSVSTSEGSSINIPVGSEEAAIFEITWEDGNPNWEVIRPDGSVYPLNLSGDNTNYILENGSKKAYVILLHPSPGTWTVKTGDTVLNPNVKLISVKQAPKISNVEVAEDNGQYHVKWNTASSSDTTVSLYFSDKKGHYAGELLKDNLAPSGETTVSLPSSLPSGTYWIYAKAERADIGVDWKYADQQINYKDPNALSAPNGLNITSVKNGLMEVHWNPVDGAKGYVLGYVDENEQFHMDNSIYVEEGTKATISNWEQGKMYNISVLSVKSESNFDGEIYHYSSMSPQVSIFFPIPNPPEQAINWEPEDGKIGTKTVEINGNQKQVQYIHSKNIRIKGTITSDDQPNTKILVNGNERTNIFGNNLDQTVTLDDGYNKVEVVSTNTRGDESSYVEEIVVDNIAPVLFMNEDLNGALLKGPYVYLSGETEPGAILTVNGQNVSVEENGQFAYDLHLNASQDKDFIVVESSDISGNMTRYIAEVTVLDHSAPTPPNVNVVSDSDTMVNGTAEPLGLIEVLVGSDKIGEGRADNSGQFSVKIPKQKAGTQIIVTVSDDGRNVSDPTSITVVDKTAPSVPILTTLTDRDTFVKGTTEPNAGIIVKVGSTVIGTGTADKTGLFQIKIQKLKAGTKITVSAKDAMGNVSGNVSITVLDKTAPSVPSVKALSDRDTLVKGTTEAMARLTVKVGTKVIGTGAADKFGNFQVKMTKLKAGTKVSVTAQDSAGNVSVAKSITVLDKTAPVVPSVTTVTNKIKVLTGKAEAGAIVTVTIGTKKYIAKADTKGNYKVTIPLQKAGTKLTVTAKDAAGNISVAKSVVVIDKTAPLAPKIKTAVKRTTKEVTGTAEAYSTITIKVGKKVIGTAKADSKGKFKVKIKAQKKKTVLSVTATDKAKNVSKAVTVKVK
jgi:hypothetical protein